MSAYPMADDTALIVVDVQNDFLPAGALPVPAGDAVIPVINALLPRFRHVFATQDWHPAGHVSFASAHPGKRPGDTLGGETLWPDHCVAGTSGAAIAPGLALPARAVFVRKGTRPDRDAYSGFAAEPEREAEGLAARLRARGVSTVYVVGLALDFCVLSTALDAARLGFRTVVVEDACRAIDVGGSRVRALSACHDAGVSVRKSGDIP